MARCNYGQLRLLAWACIWSLEDSHVLRATITSRPLCFCVFICTSLPNYNPVRSLGAPKPLNLLKRTPNDPRPRSSPVGSPL